MSRFTRVGLNFNRALRAATPYLARAAALGVGLSVVAANSTFCATSEKASGAKPDFNKVAQDIADLLESNPDFDDGSYGPLFVRLAWHASGTFSAVDKSGGSNGCLMRFGPEKDWGAVSC